MCDQEKKSAKNSEGVDSMGIIKPTKSIKPIEHEFKTNEERIEFAKWVNGQNPTPKKITDQLKSDLKRYRMMKKRQNEKKN